MNKKMRGGMWIFFFFLLIIGSLIDYREDSVSLVTSLHGVSLPPASPLQLTQIHHEMIRFISEM